MAGYSPFINYEEFIFLKHTLFQHKRLDLNEMLVTSKQGLLTVSFLRHEVLQGETTLKLGLQYAKEVLYLRNYSKLPISVRLTVNLLLLMTASEINYREIGLELVRGLNQIVDMNQKTRKSRSFFAILRQLGFHPDMSDLISELRHSLVHKGFPDDREIEICLVYLICFLKENFYETTLYRNVERFSISRLEWVVAYANKAFNSKIDSKLIVKDLPRKALAPQPVSDVGKFETKVQMLLAEPDCSAEELIHVGKKLKIKNYKAIALTEVLKNLLASPENSRLVDLTTELIARHINVSEMRSALSCPDLRRQIIALKAHSCVYETLQSIASTLSAQFKPLLNKRRLGMLFEDSNGTEASEEFDEKAFKRLIDNHKTENVMERLLDYCAESK